MNRKFCDRCGKEINTNPMMQCQDPFEVADKMNHMHTCCLNEREKEIIRSYSSCVDLGHMFFCELLNLYSGVGKRK